MGCLGNALEVGCFFVPLSKKSGPLRPLGLLGSLGSLGHIEPPGLRERYISAYGVHDYRRLTDVRYPEVGVILLHVWMGVSCGDQLAIFTQ